MDIALFDKNDTQEVIRLFTEVFSVAESETEGEVIGHLVSELVITTESTDLLGFVTRSENKIIGCIFFSRFLLPGNNTAFILSPVAISTHQQKRGVGQALIKHGLEHLKTLNIAIVLTYGDPQFYAKTGFIPVSEAIIKAPFPLSQPEGWLAQTLNGTEIKPQMGKTHSVKALSDPKYW